MIAKRRTMPEFMPPRLANCGNRIRQARPLLTVIPHEQAASNVTTIAERRADACSGPAGVCQTDTMISMHIIRRAGAFIAGLSAAVLILAGPVDRLPGHRHRDRYVGGRRGDQFPGAAEQRPELRCLAAHDRLSGVPRCKLSMSRGHPSVLRGFGTGSPAACWQSR